VVERWFAGGTIGWGWLCGARARVLRGTAWDAPARVYMLMLSTPGAACGPAVTSTPDGCPAWTFTASGRRSLSTPRRSTDTSNVGDDGHQRSGDVEQVLLGLADGSYVLGTPEGAVAECGAGAVALLGASAETLAGRATADALLAGADAETRAALERDLRSDRAGAGSLVVRTQTPAGAQRSLRLVVITVPLALGWEFTSLLGELGSRDAATWDIEALRVRHGRALEAIERVCDDGAQPDPGARLAGILVVVRDVDAPPLTREDVDRRMAEHRAAARVAAEAPDAGLEDLVERARILRERVEDAEREREDALAQLAAASAELDAEAGQREARDEAHARARAAEADAEAARAQAAAARADAERAHEELAAVRGDLERTRAQLEATRAERDATRAEVEATRAELDAARAEVEAARAEVEATRAELAAARADAERARAEHEHACIRADRLLDEARSARAAAEAIRAEFTFEHPDPGPAPPAAAAPALPPAVPGQAIALIGPGGSFTRLDDAFCSLLGCREEDLRSARWPSIIDRENLAAHHELARALRAGEIDSADVETVYMHTQGLLVPIAGTVSAHRADGDGDGPATHLLFRADVRRTLGTGS
jgi:PAS domain S-box-containing protein